jgi:hypothetical protein
MEFYSTHAPCLLVSRGCLFPQVEATHVTEEDEGAAQSGEVQAQS